MSRNIGLSLAAGEFVSFVDDDGIPEPEWLRDLRAGYDRDEVGGTGGVVYDHTGWHYQYMYATADRLGNASWNRDAPADEYSFPFSNEFPYLQGTNASFRRAALMAVGGFDEVFDFYLDETDLCCRLVDHGYLIRQLPNARVHHKFLPSHIRNTHRVTRNKLSVMKNKIYFSLVNNHGHYRLNDVLEDARKFIAHQAEDLRIHAEAGRISEEDVAVFWDHVDEAWTRGLTAGLTGARAVMNAERREASPPPFQEYPRVVPSNGRKVFCFLSREYPPGRIGGIGTYTQSVAAGLAEAGHHVHVVTQSEQGNTRDFEGGAWVHRIEVKHVPQDLLSNLSIPQHIWNYSASMREELHRINRARKITTVEAPIWDIEGIATLLDGSFPSVVSLHTTLGIWLETHEAQRNDDAYMRDFGQPMVGLERFMFESATGIHANSHAIVDRLSELYSVSFDPLKTRVIHHGVQDPLALPRTLDSLEKTGNLHILFVGRLEQRKGIDILLETVSPLLSLHANLIWDIVGDDTIPWAGRATFREGFATWPSFRACAPHVRFHGKVSPEVLRGLFEQAEIVVVPSRFESFGLTVIEAFAYGKSVVTTRAGGIPEIVTDNVNGLLVAPDDAAGLAAALDLLISDAKLRKRLGSAGRAEYERRFTEKRMAGELAEFLSSFERSSVPPSEVKVSGNPKRNLHLWETETGIGLRKGDYLELPTGEGTLFLTFWRHGWSGHVGVRIGEAIVKEWDLYAPIPWLATFQIDSLSSTDKIRIEATGRSNDLSKGDEAIFYKASWRRSPSSSEGPIIVESETQAKSSELEERTEFA
jgi:glycosyltransferase involved in cell wall biosynthesis